MRLPVCRQSFYTAVSKIEQESQPMTQATVQWITGILAVILIAIIILRRKAKKKDEDEF